MYANSYVAKQRQIVKGTKTQKTPKELKAWEREKKLIPVMIKKYCHGKHGTKGEELCEECGWDCAELYRRLASIGCIYDEEKNRFY